MLGTVHAAAASQICAPWPFNDICVNVPTTGGGGNGGGKSNCFLRGTKILTAEGERKIEDLAIAIAADAFRGLRPIQWIGRYSFKKRDPSEPWVKDALPVRMTRPPRVHVPYSDLYVTRDTHC